MPTEIPPTKERCKPMPHVDPEEQAKIVEKAIENWMNQKFAEFGKWTARGIAVLLFGALCSYLMTHGWKPL